MHDDQEAADLIGNALPEHQPPPRFDLDRIVRDGYRVRRRNRIAVGGSAALGVIAAIGAIALLVSFQPAGPPPAAEDPTADITGPPDQREPVDDTAMAGYPYDPNWEFSPEADADADAINEAAIPIFRPLMEKAGLQDFYPVDVDDYGSCFTGGRPTNENEDCRYGAIGMVLSGRAVPGNYGQVYLRRFSGGLWLEDESDSPTIEANYYLPGGWTPKPGPVTDQFFPRHIIGDRATYTGEDPRFGESVSDDGRTYMVANHGCAYEVAVLNPGGTAFTVAWNRCGADPSYPIELDELIDAALAMPQFEFDTAELQPVDELWDVPVGWLWDREWQDGEGAAAATSGVEPLLEVFDRHFPETSIDSGLARQHSIWNQRGSTHIRAYRYSGTLPLAGTDGGDTVFAPYEFRYLLPGGWLPGIGEGELERPHIALCDEPGGADCHEFEQDGWIVTTEVMEHDYEVSVVHPDGWGARMWVGFDGNNTATPVDEIVALMLDVPAPPYDPDEVPEIPAG